MLLSEKKNGLIKGPMVYNGNPTHEWLSREDTTSPTVLLESIFLTMVIDAKEGNDVFTAVNVPNAFIQANMPETKPGQEQVIMKNTGVSVDLLVMLAAKTYAKFVLGENGKKVVYVMVAIC